MPRTEAETVPDRRNVLSETGNWKCSACGAIGQFASESSAEWAEFANDLVFEAYAASLQKAGYEVKLYSAECDHGNHDHCSGKNPVEAIPFLQDCRCECHTGGKPVAGKTLP